MAYIVAVVGATGNVGREMLNILDERKFPIARVDAVASRKSQGKEVSFGDKTLKCQALEFYDFAQADIALFACGSGPTKEYAPKAAAAGCVVIDNSSLYRMDEDVPLIVPEVNPADLAGYTKRNIIANPNCSTAQLVVALKPLHDIGKIRRAVVATYQSVSGAGNAAMDELFTQTRAVFVNDELKRENFTKQIAFNVIPHIDVFMEDGSTKEEWKMVAETKKMMGADIALTTTCVRVPVLSAIPKRSMSRLKIRSARRRRALRWMPRRACCWSIAARMKAMSHRLNVSANMRLSSLACGLTRPWKMASICGSCRIIYAKAQRLMRCRLPNC